ncbi:MAG: P-loop NTPase fold protein [Solirubrobacterales bacterium]
MDERFEYRPDGLRKIDSDDSDPFGHRDYAAAIVAALDSLPVNFTMGLFGPWGSGKSTILEEVRRRITSDEAAVRSGFVLFDAWRYDGDPLRREFLKESARTLSEQGLLEEKAVGDLDESLDLDQTTPEIPAMRLLDRHLYKRAAFGAATVTVIILAAVFGLPALGLEKETILAFLFAISSALTAFGLLALQPALAPAPVQKTKRRAEYPDEFSAAFRSLLDNVDVERLVIAVDNLDRCSPGRVTQTLATIKTFLEPAFDEGHPAPDRRLKQLCFIVAADDAALKRHLTAQELSASAATVEGDQGISADSELPREVRDSVDEYLRKFFGASIRIREVLDEDISRFCKEEFAGFFKVRPTIGEEARRDLVEMTSQALKRNPRRIVQFVNNLALRLDLLEERVRQGRIQIQPEALVVAKLAILEEEFPHRFAELQERPQALDDWQIEARTPNADAGTEGDDGRHLTKKSESDRLADFLRFTDHIHSRHLRAYLDLKQNRDELELERHAELVELLDGGDIVGLRSLLDEVGDEAPRYVEAVERHFERNTRLGNWAKTHNTLRAVSEIPALHGDGGAIIRRLLDESLSHPGLTRHLAELNPDAVLDVGGQYLDERKFGHLVLAVATGMKNPSNSEARRRIADAISAHADSLASGSTNQLRTMLEWDEIAKDIDSYAKLVEKLPAVVGPMTAATALGQLDEQVEEGRHGDGPALRVAVVAIGRTLNDSQFDQLIRLGRTMLEGLQEADNDEYTEVAHRLRTLLRLAKETGAKVERPLPSDDERTALAAAISSRWDSIPPSSKWEALQLGVELCQAGDEADNQHGFELGQKVFDVEDGVGLEQWLLNEISALPDRFAEAVRAELAYGLANLRKRFSSVSAERILSRLPEDQQNAVVARAVVTSVEEDQPERADHLLKSLPTNEAKTVAATITQGLLDHPAESETRSREAHFLLAHQGLLGDDEVFRLGMQLAETADQERGIAIELAHYIGALKISNARHRLELVQRLLKTEAEMTAVDRKVAMLTAAVDVAGKLSSNARGAAIGRLRERLGAPEAEIAKAAEKLLAVEGESA